MDPIVGIDDPVTAAADAVDVAASQDCMADVAAAANVNVVDVAAAAADSIAIVCPADSDVAADAVAHASVVNGNVTASEDIPVPTADVVVVDGSDTMTVAPSAGDC